MVEQNKLMDQQQAYGGLVGEGSLNAITGLSQMLGQAITIHSLNPRRVPMQDIGGIVGGREAVNVGVYLTVSGSGTGHMFLMFAPQTAMELIDMILGQPPATTQRLDEMEESVMGEMGNIMGSFFLNALAEAANLSLNPSPPAVMMDMAGAIFDVALSKILEGSNEALVVETKFGTEDREIDGTLLVMPNPDLLTLLLDHLRTQ